MPKKCFQKEDYLNTIYHQKKVIYLSYLALKLRKWDQQTNLDFMCDRLDVLRPVLRITPSSDFKKPIIFNIHVHAEEGTFKMSRFVPWNSNIRDALFDGSEGDSGEIVQTPHHNWEIWHLWPTMISWLKHSGPVAMCRKEFHCSSYG